LIKALLPVFPASLALELLTGADFCGPVVPAPFDESVVVEGTFIPTTASSPYAEIRGILAAGLEKQNIDQQRQVNKNFKKSSRLQ